MLHSHDTKLSWLELACNRRNDSCNDGCGDVCSRSPSLAAPLTPIPTLFRTITLSRSHPSLVQIICCERVLTRVASARNDPDTARATPRTTTTTRAEVATLSLGAMRRRTSRISRGRFAPSRRRFYPSDCGRHYCIYICVFRNSGITMHKIVVTIRLLMTLLCMRS